MREVPAAIKSVMDKYGKEFKEIFGVEIPPFAGKLWMVGIPDFDIVKFERFLEKVGYESESGEESMAEFVEKRYGERGKELINELINMGMGNIKNE